ncbi:hypothetical protein [Kluyvera georgiana]|uniref:hypothetical protein n=1 Tax=Kluyvera georgiana TaxID=73098 RepID=UPI003D97543C
MFNDEKWGKLFFFIGLALFSCFSNASLRPSVSQETQIQDACSRTQEPAQASLCHALRIHQHVERRQQNLRFLLQQNIFSIQTYDYLWSEYQQISACSEISRFLVTHASDENATSLPFPLSLPCHALSEPPAVFVLQESIN